jgi:hypothetical protein
MATVQKQPQARFRDMPGRDPDSGLIDLVSKQMHNNQVQIDAQFGLLQR